MNQPSSRRGMNVMWRCYTAVLSAVAITSCVAESREPAALAVRGEASPALADTALAIVKPGVDGRRHEDAALQARETPEARTDSSATDSASESVVLPAGSRFFVALETTLCTDTASLGGMLAARVEESDIMEGGSSPPPGAMMMLRVEEARRGTSATDPPSLVLSPQRISANGIEIRIVGEVADLPLRVVRAASQQDDMKTVAGAAVVGAIAGRLLGKGAGNGALAGAAIGGAAAAYRAPRDACVDAGQRFTVQLSRTATQ